MKKNEVIVIDDFIDIQYQTRIKNVLLGDNESFNNENFDDIFSWIYVDDVTATGDSDSKHRPGMAHQYVDLPYEEERDLSDGTINDGVLGHVISEYHELFIPLLKKVGFKLGLNDVKVLQGRSFLQFPINTDGTIDTPHIDIHGNNNFIVALYYVCDSDGDTVIYNERIESKKYTINKRVTPKQGRMVIFDGGLYHAAEQPINSNTRCIVNYNLGVWWETNSTQY